VVHALAVVAAPPQDNLSPRLLLWPVRRPRGLAGVACSFAGDLALLGTWSGYPSAPRPCSCC
jgi:hypothetical protein